MRWTVVGWVVACAACGAGDGQRAVVEDSTARPSPPAVGAADAERTTRIDVLRVNRGTQGMRATVRWVLSPDRRALLAVEDPVSVEAEALPDGFLYVSERTGGILQQDSVWDVAPSPDWTRLAFGRAYILRAGERDTVPPEEWQRVEARLPEDVAARDARTLRRRLEAHAFPASGMAMMLGLGLTQVVWVDTLRAGHAPSTVGPTHSLHGWRVRWMRDGDILAVGASPRMVQDDSPPTRWVLVRPRRWAVYTDSLGGTTDSTRFARVNWREGPTIELGSPVDLSLHDSISFDGGTIDTRGGSIRLITRDASGRERVRLVGPGVALAATATGQFILALVPRTNARELEMVAQLVVYHVTP